MGTDDYDPFAPGPDAVGVTTIRVPDPARDRVLPCEVWYPTHPDHAAPAAAEHRDAPPRPGAHPLVVYSHHSVGGRRAATFVCAHLAGHGYVVAAPDHSDVVALPPPVDGDDPTGERHRARLDAIIAARVPDVRVVLDAMLSGTTPAGTVPAGVDPDRVGLVGHSFGGWTVLAAPDVEPRVRSVVAHAPGGSSTHRPGILPVELAFAWDRDVPALYLAAGDDVSIPPEDVREVFDRTPGTPRMFTLCRADHLHFVDDVETKHEELRAMELPEEAAWIPAAMRPITELCGGAQAHLFVRGLTLAHLDATLRDQDGARRLLDGDVVGALAARGVDATAATRGAAGPGAPGR